jgi:DNA repair exonuclease SbcCD ATPase subunit
MLGNFIAHNKVQTNISLISASESEIKQLKTERDDIQIKIEATQEAEQLLSKEYTALQAAIEREKDKNRDAEKAVFRIMAEQNEVISELNTIRTYYEKLALIETTFDRELEEAAHLVGRAILQFSNVRIYKDSGVSDKLANKTEVPLEDIVNESRSGSRRAT